MTFREKFSEWLKNDAAPTYGMIVIGIFSSSFIGAPQLLLAIWQSLVGTDYVATSFAFIFTAHYTWSGKNAVEGSRSSMWCLIACIVFFIFMKVAPANLPDRYCDFSFETMTRFHFTFPIFSIISIWLTYITLKELKFSTPVVKAVNKNDSSSINPSAG